MRDAFFEIALNEKIADAVYKMVLLGDTSEITRPGQFVNIKLDGFYLRRPISICDWDEKSLTIIYKVVGHGTEKMATMEKGEKLLTLIALGNGFDVTKSGDKPLLIGGGVGTPPMYGLAKRLVDNGVKPTVVLGFGSKTDVFYKEEFEALGCDTYITTVDGSDGTKGFVTDKTGDFTPSFYYTCGPEVMLKAVYDSVNADGELSFEERMGCGFGACMGCSCKTKYGNKRICKDGPILSKEEIIW